MTDKKHAKQHQHPQESHQKHHTHQEGSEGRARELEKPLLHRRGWGAVAIFVLICLLPLALAGVLFIPGQSTEVLQGDVILGNGTYDAVYVNASTASNYGEAAAVLDVGKDKNVVVTPSDFTGAAAKDVDAFFLGKRGDTTTITVKNGLITSWTPPEQPDK